MFKLNSNTKFIKKMSKFIAFILLLGVFTPVWASPKISPALQQKMNETTDNDFIPIYILFDKHLTLQDFSDIAYDTPKNERRRIVIDRLKNFSQAQQRNVKLFLDIKASENKTQKYEVLWMNNSLVLNSSREAILDLVKFNEVTFIDYDQASPIEELRDVINYQVPFNNAQVQLAVNPGIPSLKVDLCWAEGNKGKGVLVANVDDGFWWKHPDVVKGVYQNLGEDANGNGRTVEFGTGTASVFDPGDINGIDDDGNGKVDDFIGWDFTTNSYNITSASHGTATLSQVIGDGTMGTQTGVAPEAKCLLMRNASTQTQQWSAFQYGVEMGADIITSSLSWKWVSRPNYSQFRIITDMSLAAGTVHTNSTSNDGNNNGFPLNNSTAGNVPAPWLHPDQILRGGIGGVIGTANITVRSNVINSSSPRGPALWGNWAMWGQYTNPMIRGL